MDDRPNTHYVKSDDVHIAYQVFGEGSLDLVFVPGFVSNIDALWQSPDPSAFFRRLGSFCRVILFDKRGTGMSDRGSEIFTLEQRMHDVRAVLDEVGSERAALFGVSEGGPMSLLYAATYPARTSALVLYGSYARRSWAPDYMFGWNDEQWERLFNNFERHWGTPQSMAITMFAPSAAGNRQAAERLASLQRAAASPGAAIAIMKMNRYIDVRHVLPSIQAPTLILHRAAERVVVVEHARYMAERIPGAKLIELAGIDHNYSLGDRDALLDQVELFLTGARHAHEPERVLATVLFTDIVDSTKRAVEVGDRVWRELIGHHHFLVRQQLERHRGREIKTTGDGFLAAFDGPARAVRCGRAIVDAIKSLNMQIRAGVHTGECEIIGEELGGIAVHIGARVAALAQPGEVLVSRTVRDLVAGSGLQFEERGTHTLKGVPGTWPLFAAASTGCSGRTAPG